MLPFDPIAEAHRNWSAAGWAEAADGMAFVTSIMRVQQICMAWIDEVLAPFGLTFARFEALRLLAFTRQGRLPLGKIGERLQVHPASVTNVVDRLERDMLVRRLPHATDGRTTLAAITPKGRRLVATATDALNTKVFQQTGLSDPQLRDLVATLAELRQSAGDFDDPTDDD
ncbi:MAG: MarR family winged helix-turn-helix transcriptional regulator [Acidimicrobiia bacterium]